MLTSTDCTDENMQNYEREDEQTYVKEGVDQPKSPIIVRNDSKVSNINPISVRDSNSFTEDEISKMPIVFTYIIGDKRSESLALENEAKLIRAAESKVKSTVCNKSATVEIYRGAVQEMDLPNWIHVKRKRLNKERHIDNYYITPEGKYKLRSKVQVQKFVAAFNECGNEDEALKKMKSRYSNIYRKSYFR